VELGLVDLDELDVVERGAGRRARRVVEEAHLAEALASAEVSQPELAARERHRHAHEAEADYVEGVRRLALPADHVARVEGADELDFLRQLVEELPRDVLEDPRVLELPRQRALAVSDVELLLEGLRLLVEEAEQDR